MSESPETIQPNNPLPKWLWGCLIGFVAARIILFLFAYRSFIDDTYIFMRYADNIAFGRGPVFNPGEPVMGFTSPLYTFLLGFIRLVTQSLPFESVLLALSMLTLGSLTIAIYRIAEKQHAKPAIFILFWLAYFSYVDASINGMETLLFCLLIFGGVYSLQRQKDSLTGLIAAAAILTRPEGVFVALAMLGYVLWQRRLSYAWKGALAGIAVIVVWGFWAQSYYGSFLPQSMLAKSAAATQGLGATPPNPMTVLTSLAFGIADDQVTSLPRIGTYGLYAVTLVLAGLLIWNAKEQIRQKNPAVILTGFFFLAWAFYVGGRAIHLWSWYTIPTSLCFMFSATSALGRWIELKEKPKLHVAFAAGAALLCIVSLGIGLTRRLERFEVLTRAHSEVAAYIVQNFPKAKSVALGDIGIVGYETRLRIVDIAMLVTPSAAKTDADGRLISVAKVAELEKPDVILLTADPYKVKEVILAQMSRPTFKSDRERDWFTANYVRVPFKNVYHTAVFVRREVAGQAD